MKKMFIGFMTFSLMILLSACGGYNKNACNVFTTYDYYINDYDMYDAAFSIRKLCKEEVENYENFALQGQNTDKVEWYLTANFLELASFDFYFRELPEEDVVINKITFTCNDKDYYIKTRITFHVDESYDPFGRRLSPASNISNFGERSTFRIMFKSSLFDENTIIKSIKLTDSEYVHIGHTEYIYSDGYVSMRETEFKEIKDLPIDKSYKYTSILISISANVMRDERFNFGNTLKVVLLENSVEHIYYLPVFLKYKGNVVLVFD